MNSKSTVLVAFLLSLLFIPDSVALATAVDRMSICNLEGYPGKTVDMEITLEGTGPEERVGFWYTHYKKVEGDDDRMDITSWITIEPKDYTVKQGETKAFTVKVKIPNDAGPRLWGATSEEAGKEGHSSERRTYIVFKDTIAGGNVYSGLLLPISVKVLESPASPASPSPLAPMINFVRQNTITIVLSIVIIILLARPLLKRKKRAKR